MAPPPARQSFGAPRNGSTGPLPDLPPAPQDGPDQPGVHRTLIVSSGMDEPYPEAAHRWRPALREPRLQRLLYSRRLVYLVLALAVVLVIGLLGWWVLEGRYTSVPAVGGMTAAAARADLSDAGLTVAAGESQVDNQVTKGRVIRTIPAAGGRIARGGRVTLVVSAGPRMIAVPEVTGQPLAAADTLLRHAGLFPGAVRHQTSATIAAGVVLATRPAGGTSWPQPDPVTLVVSAGPPLPNFVGLPKTTAEGWASQNSVQLNEVAAHRSEAPAGTVIRQSLPPGHAFTPHQVITIVYSLGPPPVNIPNVDGMRVGTAVQVLTRLGFHVTVSGLKLFQTVVSYSPQGSAPKGSTITLQVGFQF
jgi:serine/threonine-protein kinase